MIFSTIALDKGREIDDNSSMETLNLLFSFVTIACLVMTFAILNSQSKGNN